MAIFSVFFNIKVCYVFSFESPHRGDSNQYTQHTIINIKRKMALNYPKSAAMNYLFQGTQERVRNSRGKRAISVRATEILLYLFCGKQNFIYITFQRRQNKSFNQLQKGVIKTKFRRYLQDKFVVSVCQ